MLWWLLLWPAVLSLIGGGFDGICGVLHPPIPRVATAPSPSCRPPAGASAAVLETAGTTGSSSASSSSTSSGSSSSSPLPSPPGALSTSLDQLSGTPCLRLISWNAQALLQWRGAHSRPKLRYLEQLQPRGAILALQEVHQDARQLRNFLSKILSNFVVRMTVCRGEGGLVRGGVATVVPDWCTVVEVTRIVRGRALRTVVRSASGATLFHYNIHNHKLSPAQVRLICVMIDEDQVRARASPDTSAVFVMGDFNFSADSPLTLNTPTIAERRHHGRATLWRSTLERLLEIETSEPTHFQRGSNAVSCIDRCWSSLPGWVATQLFVEAGVQGSPEELASQNISDHAALVVTLRPRLPRPPHQRNISKEVFRSPLFAHTLNAYLPHVDLEAMSPPVALDFYKMLLREAARLTREFSVRLLFRLLSSLSSLATPESTVPEFTVPEFTVPSLL